MVAPKKKVEAWAAEADLSPAKTVTKKMGISFNEEEYNLLKDAASKTKRSMQNYIRYAVEKAAREDLNS